MNPRKTAIAAIFFVASAALSLAQEGSTSMAGGSDASSSPFGMKMLSKDRPKDAQTEITASKQATFDNASSIAEFEGKVIVRDPQFTLFCDRLKVTLNEKRKGIKVAEAVGNVVIVQENTDASGGKVKSIGRSGKAVFEPDTGKITLTVWPQVQHGINNQVATEESTVMILNRNGQSKTEGGSKTVIVDTNSEQS